MRSSNHVAVVALALQLALGVTGAAPGAGAATAQDSLAKAGKAAPSASTAKKTASPSATRTAPAASAPPLAPGAKSPHPAHPEMKMARGPHYGAANTGIKTSLKLRAVTLHIFHRVFARFHDQVDAKLHTEFRIGDSDYTAIVTEFVPDFDMDLKSHKVVTRSDQPNNPAFHIIVRKKGVPQDTTWAFLDMPPHFARQSLVAFLATQATFENHAPVVSHDSLAVRLMKAGVQ